MSLLYLTTDIRQLNLYNLMKVLLVFVQIIHRI